MCTLNIALGGSQDYPLVVIANRDEFYGRPSASPSIISEDPIVFAPRDLEAGGTWFGVNEWGLVAAITNVWPGLKAGEVTRSRGLLTLDALGCKTVDQARRVLREKMNKDTYDSFNLLVASRDAATVFTHAGNLREYPLSHGSATILNFPFSPHDSVKEKIPSLGDGNDPELEEIRAFLSRHPEVCKHSESFGTRSSQIVALGSRSGSRFWYSDGPPCKTEFEDLSSQFQF